MSYGYSANHAYVLNVEKVKELNLPTWDDFYQALIELNDLQEYIYHNYITDKKSQTVFELEQKVQEEFKEATGLYFDIAYHDSDNNGDCYDDVNGIFFRVSGVETFTLAGKKAYDTQLITEALWVTCG